MSTARARKYTYPDGWFTVTRWTNLLLVGGKAVYIETKSTDVNAALEAASDVHGKPLEYVGTPEVENRGPGRNPLRTIRVRESRRKNVPLRSK